MSDAEQQAFEKAAVGRRGLFRHHTGRGREEVHRNVHASLAPGTTLLGRDGWQESKTSFFVPREYLSIHDLHAACASDCPAHRVRDARSSEVIAVQVAHTLAGPRKHYGSSHTGSPGATSTDAFATSSAARTPW